MTSKAQHTRNLQRAGLPTVETLTRRILAVFAKATPADIEAGSVWYDEQGALASSLSGSFTREQVAGAISHLSPRLTWGRNVVAAIELVNDPTVRPAGIIGRSYNGATQALATYDVESTFGGPKTLRFFRNIVGDREAVTIDVWACRVAGVDEALLSRKGVYDAIERAYQDAARQVGVEPSTMQATTWIVARGGRAS